MIGQAQTFKPLVSPMAGESANPRRQGNQDGAVRAALSLCPFLSSSPAFSRMDPMHRDGINGKAQ